MALRDRLPWMTWQETIRGGGDATARVMAYGDGIIALEVTQPQADGRAPVTAAIVFPASRRDHLKRALLEACRRADGEPPAGEAREHG